MYRTGRENTGAAVPNFLRVRCTLSAAFGAGNLRHTCWHKTQGVWFQRVVTTFSDNQETNFISVSYLLTVFRVEKANSGPATPVSTPSAAANPGTPEWCPPRTKLGSLTANRAVSKRFWWRVGRLDVLKRARQKKPGFFGF